MTKYILALAISLLATFNMQAEKLTATIETSKGTIVLELHGKDTPLTVASFVNLANRGYYDGLDFHRVIPDFMIQGGCPDGRGTGNPGYKFEDEFPRDASSNLLHTHNQPGIFSMANSGPTTNGSQFFITHKATNWLDGKHTVFGKVITGLDVVNKIAMKDKIISVRITGDIPAEMKKLQSRVDEWNKILDGRYKHLKPASKL